MDSSNKPDSSEKFNLLDWFLESSPKIPKSDAVALPGLSLFDSANESDKVIVKRDSLEHKAYYKAQQAAVRFNMDNGFGSGFFISDDGLVVTASHVVPEGQSRANIDTVDGTKYSAELLSRDVNNDLALLKVTGTDKATKFPFLALNIEEAYSEKLAVTGHPHGWPSVYISMGLGYHKPFRTDKLKNSDDLLVLYAHVVGGNSGGAVIDGCGTARGVMVAGGLGVFGVAIPSKSVDNLVRWTNDRARAPGIDHEGGYRTADYELAQAGKKKGSTAEEKPKQPQDEFSKTPEPGTFRSPYGKIYRDPANYYERKTKGLDNRN